MLIIQKYKHIIAIPWKVNGDALAIFIAQYPDVDVTLFHLQKGLKNDIYTAWKVNFYVLYGNVKKVLCPLWPTVNGAFMFFVP